MISSILQVFGNGKICIVQLNWMPTIHTKCPPSLGTSFYMADTFHVFCTSGGCFTHWKLSTKHPLEKASLNLSSGGMKCFDPQQKRCGVQEMPAGFSPKVTFSEIWILEKNYETSSQNRVLGQKNVDMKNWGTWFRWEMHLCLHTYIYVHTYIICIYICICIYIYICHSVPFKKNSQLLRRSLWSHQTKKPIPKPSGEERFHGKTVTAWRILILSREPTYPNGKRKIIFEIDFSADMSVSQEGKKFPNALVSWGGSSFKWHHCLGMAHFRWVGIRHC